jgi:hypothetical protein
VSGVVSVDLYMQGLNGEWYAYSCLLGARCMGWVGSVSPMIGGLSPLLLLYPSGGRCSVSLRGFSLCWGCAGLAGCWGSFSLRCWSAFSLGFSFPLFSLVLVGFSSLSGFCSALAVGLGMSRPKKTLQILS